MRNIQDLHFLYLCLSVCPLKIAAVASRRCNAASSLIEIVKRESIPPSAVRRFYRTKEPHNITSQKEGRNCRCKRPKRDIRTNRHLARLFRLQSEPRPLRPYSTASFESTFRLDNEERVALATSPSIRIPTRDRNAVRESSILIRPIPPLFLSLRDPRIALFPSD